MFEGLEGLFGQNDDQPDISSDMYTRMRGANCAATLPAPPEPRQDSNFVGLSNQGATCYLNSLIQVCFNTPELRAALF